MPALERELLYLQGSPSNLIRHFATKYICNPRELGEPVTQFLFSGSLFLSAFLLFVIQPMVAKTLLPVYGGTPAVWTVCMLFFQFLLLGSYGYAYLLSRLRDMRAWRWSHALVVLISLFTLPISVFPSTQKGLPEFRILEFLILQLGLPLLVIGASAPLLQFAYSRTQEKRAHDPYFLYVASNIGSLLALLAYPWLIERFIGLKDQFFIWSVGYYLYVFLLFLVLLLFTYRQIKQISSVHSSWQSILQWISYSFIPCSLFLGVTFYISTDVAATPWVWILPLSLYLLSFIITFAKRPMISQSWLKRNFLLFLVFPLMSFILDTSMLPLWQLMVFHLANFFILALLCHGYLVAIRPPASQLTIFYLCLALGGVLAGIFNGLLAPRVFNGAYEYPFMLALSMLVIPLSKTKNKPFLPVIVLLLLTFNYFLPIGILTTFKYYHVAEIVSLVLIVLWPGNNFTLFLNLSILLIFLFAPWFKSNVLFQQRNFYGVKQVTQIGEAHALISQSTVHGFQLPGKERLNGSMAYYGPMWSVVWVLRQEKNPLSAAILGLGTGMSLCQFQKEDRIKIIDIDEQVIGIAKNAQLFTYLRDCPAKPLIIEGDGRLMMQKIPDSALDLLVVDAFSSDAIPIHLLTWEAFKLYQQKIKTDAVILIHISNRNLNLLPVITTVGHRLNWIILSKEQAANVKEGQLASEWALLTANEKLAFSLMQKAGWRFVTQPSKQLWTDDYSNLVPLLKW
jgi:hypothetical protein